MTAPWTIVTVTFGAEYDLLRLQARSLAKYLDVPLREFVVIDNGWHRMSGRQIGRIRAELGRLGPALRVVPASEIAHASASGWRTQQALKLAIARDVSTAQYLLLDAKNHLVRPLTLDSLIDKHGLPLAGRRSFEEHPLRPQLEQTLTYLGLDPVAHLGDFTPTTTPFVMDTARVLETIETVGALGSGEWTREFERAGLTEFFLYAGSIVRSGTPLSAAFSMRAHGSSTVWPRMRTAEAVAAVVAEAEDAHHVWFAVHRAALARMDRSARNVVERYWAARGLFTSPSRARRFVRTFRARYVVESLGKKAFERLPRR